MQNFIKNFTDWFSLKPKLDKLEKFPKFQEGDVWWCHIGENIGSEVSGKSKNFTRPVIILKKLSRFQFMIIPCSTKIREGSWFIPFRNREKHQIANLAQARTIDYKRLRTFIGDLDKKDFYDIKKGFLNIYK